MMKTKVYEEFLRIFILFFLALTALWAGFYALNSNMLRSAYHQNIQQTVDHLLEDLSENIERMQRINYIVGARAQVQAFLQVEDILHRHGMAEEVHMLLQQDLLSIGNRFSIVLVDHNGWFYRFSGSITHTECEKLALLAQDVDYSSHLTFSLNGNNFIGYASEIFGTDGAPLGSVFVVENEQNFLEYFYGTDEQSTVSAAILSGDLLISTNATALASEQTPLYTEKQVGITPFQVAAWLNPEHEMPLDVYFALGIVATSLILLGVLFLFARTQSKRFLQPIAHLIEQVDRADFDAGERLMPVQVAEFDGLIDKLNQLIVRLGRQNKAVNESMLLLERSKTESQQAINFSLKKQINAHFIVNTLTSIRTLRKHEHIEQSETALAQLCDIVRYAFDGEDTISIWDELAHLQTYIGIMNLRYNNKIILEMEADDSLMDVPIARMILQPILENSVLHGFVHKREDCRITITARRVDEEVLITLCDNGCGIAPDVLQELNSPVERGFHPQGMDSLEHMAIFNVKRRLRNSCDGASFVMTSTRGEGACTTIRYNAAQMTDA